MIGPAMVTQLEAALVKAARICVVDPRALPVFERIDRELRAAQAMVSASSHNDPVQRARAMLIARQVAA